jgi:prophage tail gpP-like protein
MADDLAVLKVNGKNYGAWTSMKVVRTYGAGTSAFEFSATEPLDVPIAASNWKINPGDQCVVQLAGITAITGYIFTRQPAFDAASHGVIFTGRSLTADGVDSAAAVPSGEFKGYTFEAIANALAKPAGVKVIVRGASPLLGKPFNNFSIHTGETAWMAIERLARMRGLHLFDNADGNWVAEAFDPNQAAAGRLVEGGNMKKARAVIDVSRVFGLYNIRAQQPGSDELHGRAARDVSASVKNPSGRPTRISVTWMEEPGSAADAAARANQEAGYAGAAIINADFEVQGWQSAPDALWDIGKNYAIESPTLDLKRTLTSREVTYMQGPGGSLTTISMCTPESLAFSAANISASTPAGGPFPTDVPPAPARPDPPDAH